MLSRVQSGGALPPDIQSGEETEAADQRVRQGEEEGRSEEERAAEEVVCGRRRHHPGAEHQRVREEQGAQPPHQHPVPDPRLHGALGPLLQTITIIQEQLSETGTEVQKCLQKVDVDICAKQLR